jgi:hypothetical protein
LGDFDSFSKNISGRASNDRRTCGMKVHAFNRSPKKNPPTQQSTMIQAIENVYPEESMQVCPGELTKEIHKPD